MSREDAIAIGTFFGGIALAIYGGWVVSKPGIEFRARCEAAGGIAFKPASNWVCLSRDQLKRLPE